MSIPSSLKYLFTVISSVILLLLPPAAQAQVVADTVAVVDSTSVSDTAVKREIGSRQLVFGADIILPARAFFETQRKGYEFQADYYLHGEIYLAAEGGWGSSNVNYTDLKYTTTNQFVRIGFNKVLLPRENAADWGGLLLGMRLGVATIHRSPVTYTIVDSLWGSSDGALRGKQFNGYWMEINGGVRVELVKGLLAGWLVRGKFLLNHKDFKDLAPIYVAGYGRGDKNAVFDINFYLSYAIRWKRR
jgi:hypothetical protein